MGYNAEDTTSFLLRVDEILRKNTGDVLADMHRRNPNEFGFEDAFFCVWAKQIDAMLDVIVRQTDVYETPIYLELSDFQQYACRLLDLLPDWIVCDELIMLLCDELYCRFYRQSCFFLTENGEIMLLHAMTACQ